MEEHIKELFEKALDADNGEWCKDPEYEKALDEAFDLEYLMKLLHGPTAHKLLIRFLDRYWIVECFHDYRCFREGYLAAQRELGGGLSESDPAGDREDGTKKTS